MHGGCSPHQWAVQLQRFQRGASRRTAQRTSVCPAFADCLSPSESPVHRTSCLCVWLQALKEQLQLTQGDLDTIGAYPYLSGLLGWIPGHLNDRAGPRVAVAAGCGGMCAALVLYWAVATRRLELGLSPVATLASIMCIVQWSNCGIAAGIFSSLVKNFPLERGVVAGIAKAWIGLSSGILTQLYLGFVGVPDNSPETLNFVLAMAVAALIAGVGPAMLIVIHPLPSQHAAAAAAQTRQPARSFFARQRAGGVAELWVRLAGFYVVIFAMAGLITASSLVGGGRRFAVAIVVALCSPILFAMPWPTAEVSERKRLFPPRFWRDKR